MRYNFAVSASLGGLLLTTGLAHAAPPVDWSGYYAGVSAGVLNLSVKQTDPFASETWTSSYSGLVGTLAGGYNLQSDELVYGVEADIGLAGVSGTDDQGIKTTIGSMGSLRGRVGVATGNLLFFATGGVAAANISISQDSGPGYQSSALRFGPIAGVGAEYALSHDVSLKAAFSAANFGSITTASGPYTLTSEPTVGIGQIGANFHF